MNEYIPLLVFTIAAPLIVTLILVLNNRVSPRRLDVEKSMAYECGFDPFVDARVPFDVGFYLVGILFLVFDVEIAFLFPWALSAASLGWEGFTTMWLFMFVLIAGFMYEWIKGALDWN